MAGTILDKLNRLKETKEAFRAAIVGKGQTITDEPFSAWPAKVAAIEQSGGGGSSENPTFKATAIGVNPTVYRTTAVTGLDANSFANRSGATGQLYVPA